MAPAAYNHSRSPALTTSAAMGIIAAGCAYVAVSAGQMATVGSRPDVITAIAQSSAPVLREPQGYPDVVLHR